MWKCSLFETLKYLLKRISVVACHLFLRMLKKKNYPQRSIMENNGFHDQLHGTDGVSSLLMKDKDQSVTKTHY